MTETDQLVGHVSVGGTLDFVVFTACTSGGHPSSLGARSWLPRRPSGPGLTALVALPGFALAIVDVLGRSRLSRGHTDGRPRQARRLGRNDLLAVGELPT
jgi:hypothetical protein